MNVSGTGTLVVTKSLQHYKVKGKYQLFFLNKNQSLFQITNNYFFSSDLWLANTLLKNKEASYLERLTKNILKKKWPSILLGENALQNLPKFHMVMLSIAFAGAAILPLKTR